MALLASSPRMLCAVREAAAAPPHPSCAAACSTVGGVGGRALWMWSGDGGAGRGRRVGRGEGVRAEAYLLDLSRPVEMEEIDSIDKHDEALMRSVENKQPVVIV